MGCPQIYYKRALQCFAYTLVSLEDKNLANELLEEKIKNAKETCWITDGIPKWQVSLIVFFAKLKVKWRRRGHRVF